MATNNNSCEPCLRGNIESAGHSWCSDCEEVLCLACDKAHGVGKLTVSHRTTELQEIPSVPKAISVNVCFCETHSENQLEAFCTFHDILCCRACILENHRTCDNIKTVDDVASRIKSSVLVENVCKGIPALLQTLVSISDNRKINKKKINQQEIIIKSSISKLKGEVLKHLDSLEKSLNVELTRLKGEAVLKCETENKEVEGISEHFLKLKDELKFILEYGSNRKIFLFVEKLKHELSQAEAKVQKLLSELRNGDLDFKAKNDVAGIISSLGSLEIKTKSCNISHSSLFESKAQLPIQRYRFNPVKPIDLTSLDTTSITGIEITQEGNLVLCDFYGRRVILCQEDGTFINVKNIKGRPYQISAITGNEVAITDCNSPCIVVLETNTLEVRKHLKTEKAYYGIKVLKDMFLLGGDQEIDVMSMDGEINRTISVPSLGFVRYIYCNDEKTLLCSSSTEFFRLQILDGKQMFRFQLTSEPRGIAEDRFGNIYIADKSQRNIHQISMNGSSLGIALRETNGLCLPLAIQFSRDFSRLYVGFVQNNYLGIYECK